MVITIKGEVVPDTEDYPFVTEQEQSIKAKNQWIARMIWKLTQGKYFWYWERNDKEKTKIRNTEPLLFHKDANWQEEAIQFIESMNFSLKLSSLAYESGYGKGAVAHYCWFIRRDENKIIESIGYNSTTGESRLETVFEAIYEFSQYLINKNENKNKD